jgi:hypothetical protein
LYASLVGVEAGEVKFSSILNVSPMDRWENKIIHLRQYFLDGKKI